MPASDGLSVSQLAHSPWVQQSFELAGHAGMKTETEWSGHVKRSCQRHSIKPLHHSQFLRANAWLSNPYLASHELGKPCFWPMHEDRIAIRILDVYIDGTNEMPLDGPLSTAFAPVI